MLNWPPCEKAVPQEGAESYYLGSDLAERVKERNG